jgi:DNA polymerase-1
MTPTTADAYNLMHSGAIALARVESNGFRVDTEYLDGAIKSTEDEITEIERGLRDHKIWRVWKRTFGDRTKLGSRPQLAKVLFDVLKMQSSGRTATKRHKTDEEALEELDNEFVQVYLRCEKKKKLLSTNLLGLKKHVQGKYVHPFYNLHTVVTFRSSASDPNSQNIPVREEEYARVVRSAFIPRRGRVFIEVDFKGAEVCASACVHEDPNLIAYVCDASKDMHRDMAGQIFKLKQKQISKPIRQEIKGDFVFAEFYGSWYKTVAPKIWKEIIRQKLKLADGTPLLAHLAEQGITELGPGERDPEPGTFEHRVWEVEQDFWGRRFRVYDKWKQDFYNAYQENGFFDMATGFRSSGIFSKKQVCNAPIQGPAFHCLLWTLIELNRWLVKHKMRTLIVGQIHDSLQIDAVPDEVDDVLDRVHYIIQKQLPKAWPWIIVPLTVEVEASEENWFKKRPWERVEGSWREKAKEN